MWNWCSYGEFLFWRWHSQPFNGRLLGDRCVWASALSSQQILSIPTFYRLAALVYDHSTQLTESEIECPQKTGVWSHEGTAKSVSDVSHPDEETKKEGGPKQYKQAKWCM